MTKHQFTGTHILGELYGIPADALNNATLLKTALANGITASGATACSWQVKCFEPNGVTVLALLAESHVSVHTYPQEGALFFDVFTCGKDCHPEEVLLALKNTLAPTRTQTQTIFRGIS